MSSPASAQQTEDAGDILTALQEIEELSLAELLRSETSLVAATPQTLRASPGILTVVTREEIHASGARDLMDVLRLVPGFGFAQDVQGVVGMGFRGIWGHEGRVLLLIDGHEMNELLYQTTQLGNHYPVELIEKVEIIRGPGSAIHGGNAELAVVNVVTRKGSQVSGLEGSVRLGTMSGGGTRRGAALAWGDQVGGGSGVEVSAAAVFGEAARSGYDYTDFAGKRFSLASDSALSPAFVKADASWRGLSVAFLYDGYRSLDRVSYGESLSRPVWIGFPGYYASASWRLAASPTVSVTPRLQYKRQAPWRSVDDKPEVMDSSYFDTVAERWTAGLQLEWNPVAGLSVIGGGEARLDHARVNPDATGEYEVGTNELLSGETSVRYHTLAAFAQLVWNNPIVNASAGARFERHSFWGNAFVPRLGLTRELGDFHFKALYSGAFKAPAIQNIELGEDVRPERTRVWEIEAGWLATENLMVAVNLFDIEIDGPTAYTVDPETFSEAYLNVATTGSRGLEAEARLRTGKMWATASWSFYTARGRNEAEEFAVEGQPDALLGFALYKGALLAGYEPIPTVTVSPSLAFFGPRWGYARADAAGEPMLEQLESTLLLDLFVTWRPPQLRGLSLAIGGHNLLGERYALVQPYRGWNGALYEAGRELSVRIGFEQ